MSDITPWVDRITAVLQPMVLSDMRWPDPVQAERRARSMAERVAAELQVLEETREMMQKPRRPWEPDPDWIKKEKP